MHLDIVASTFVIIFLAELPDKTMLSSIVMGSKMNPTYVFFGASTAFLLQVGIAVAVGGLVAEVPKRPLDIAVGVVFFIGAYLILREMVNGEIEDEEEIASRRSGQGFWPQVTLAFGITFIAEFGDLTQIATANLAAKTSDPFAVGIGAFLGLLVVTALAVSVGSKMISKIPIKPVQIASIIIMSLLGLGSFVAALSFP